jgi:hypothetical protein
MSSINDSHTRVNEGTGTAIAEARDSITVETEAGANGAELEELQPVDRVHVESIAADIEELIRNAPDEVSRQALRDLAVVVAEHTEVSWSPQKEHIEVLGMIEKLTEGGGKFGTGPEKISELLERLGAYKHDAAVAEKLTELLLTGGDGSYYAARILAGTNHQATIDFLKDSLREALIDSNWHDRDRKYRCVPYALAGSTDPEVPALLLKALDTDMTSFAVNFRSAVAATLGSFSSPECQERLIRGVYYRYEDWSIRRAVASGLKASLNESIIRDLQPLVEGGTWTAAKAIAAREHSNPIARLYKAASLWWGSGEKLHDMRVQAAIVLEEVFPEKAREAARTALRGKDANAHHSRCHFFAAHDAEELIKRINKALA